VYFRKSFDVTNPSQFGTLRVDLLRDDGAVVWLNGTEIWRSNMPTGAISHTTAASSATQNAAENQYFDSDTAGAVIPASLLRPNGNVIAVEVHQNPTSGTTTTSGDLSFDLELSARPVLSAPANTEYRLVRGRLHTFWTTPGSVLQSSHSLQPDSWEVRPETTPFALPAPDSIPQREFFRVTKP
jgi:hypothetical protein